MAPAAGIRAPPGICSSSNGPGHITKMAAMPIYDKNI